MSTVIWGTWAVGTLGTFLALEVPALRRGRRWTTLSEQVWRLPVPARVVIDAFLLLLAAHFYAHTKLFLVAG